MEKPAATEMEIAELIKRRWSPRAFDPRPVERVRLMRVLEAARWAPSAFNEQPWRFLVAPREDNEAFARMLRCLVEANRVWAKNAGVLLVGVSREVFTLNGKENRHYAHDMGLAVENMMLQAVSEGLFAHAMAGFSRRKVRETYGVPGGFEPVVAVAVGHPGDASSLPDDAAEQERASRERKPLAEIAFEDGWNVPLRSSE
ncbi:MAG: nitroreductase family protein [Synergistales bacterium]|nr:nitroreductase family protein [Synergistales bacterium]